MSDGARGAKGSISDRLISQMYRDRYKKKNLKNSYANVKGKSVQITYVNKLKTFKEAENVNTLDTKDKRLLSEVTIVLETKREIDFSKEKINVNEKKKYSGIDFYEKKTSIKDDTPVSFSGKMSEEPIDLDKEEEKLEKEVIIMDEVIKEVSKTIKQAVSVKKEMNELSKRINESNDKEEIDELKKRYDKLAAELEELKNKYYIMREKYDFDDYQVIENYTLNKNIDEYKSISNIEELEMLVSFCREESKQMEEHVIDKNIEEKKLAVSEKQENVIKDYKKLEKINEEMNFSKIENMLFEESLNQAKIIAEINEKMNRIEKSVSETIDFDGIISMFGSLIKIASGIMSLPVSSIAPNRLGSALIRNGVNRLNSVTFYQEREEYKYFDAKNDIVDGKNKLDRAEDMLDTAMDEILMTEKNFKKQFSKYAGLSPDYQKVLDKITEVKGVISKKSKEFDDYKLEFEKANNKNLEKQKVKVLVKEKNSANITA